MFPTTHVLLPSQLSQVSTDDYKKNSRLSPCKIAALLECHHLFPGQRGRTWTWMSALSNGGDWDLLYIPQLLIYCNFWNGFGACCWTSLLSQVTGERLWDIWWHRTHATPSGTEWRPISLVIISPIKLPQFELIPHSYSPLTSLAIPQVHLSSQLLEGHCAGGPWQS